MKKKFCNAFCRLIARPPKQPNSVLWTKNQAQCTASTGYECLCWFCRLPVGVKNHTNPGFRAKMRPNLFLDQQRDPLSFAWTNFGGPKSKVTLFFGPQKQTNFFSSYACNKFYPSTQSSSLAHMLWKTKHATQRYAH